MTDHRGPEWRGRGHVHYVPRDSVAIAGPLARALCKKVPSVRHRTSNPDHATCPKCRYIIDAA